VNKRKKLEDHLEGFSCQRESFAYGHKETRRRPRKKKEGYYIKYLIISRRFKLSLKEG